MNLRPYQHQVIEAVERGFAEWDRQLIVVPTGGGKTIIFSHLAHARAEKQQRTLILAHREELIDQAIDKLRQATGLQADKEKAEYRASQAAAVVVGSIQSLMRTNRLERWPKDHFDLVVVDEAHHALAASYRGILAHFDGHAQILGVTATPDRGDKKNLGDYFQNIAAEVSLFDLIAQKYLSPITIKAVPLRIDLNGVRSVAGDFNDADLGHAIEPYLGQIAGAIRDHASGRRTLVFLPLIRTSEKFVEAARAVGLTAEHVDGMSPDRRELLQRFAGWEFDVLSNAMLLTEGFDDPGIDCVVCLRPTRSRPLYAQIVGRGTRISSLKENLLLLDFLWLHEKHKIVRPANLIAKDDAEADQITKLAAERSAGGFGEEELELGRLASTAAEDRLKKKLAECQNKKARTISADEFAVQHDSLAIAEYEPVMPWESEPVTDKQAYHLKRTRIDIDTVRGKGHATKLLDVVFRDRGVGLASPNAVALMRRMSGLCRKLGITNLERPTNEEAGRFFAELRRRKGTKPQTQGTFL